MQIIQGLEQLELFLDIQKILQIQLKNDKDLDEAMFFVFNNYWMPAFSTYRDYKVVKEWSLLMPDLLK